MSQAVARQLWVASLLFLVLLAGCGEDNPMAPTGPPQSLQISGTTTFEGDLGVTSQLSAIAQRADGSTENVSDRAIWQSSDPSIVTISGTGLLTTVGYGSAEVSAEFSGLTAREDVVVTPPPSSAPIPGEISVSHGATGLPMAGLTEFLLSLPDATDPNGDPLTFDWDFGDGTIGSGRSTRHTYGNGGTFTVTATVSDGTGEAAVTTASILVESMDGTWSNTTPGGTTRTFELTQSWSSVSGTYIRDNRDTGSLSGYLDSPKRITIRARIPGDDFISISRAEINADVDAFTGMLVIERPNGVNEERGVMTWTRQ